MPTFSFATTLTLNVSWPPALAIQACSASDTPTCKYVIHLLTTYTANGLELTSTTKTCGSQTPSTTYNAVGNIAAGVPSGQVGKVLVEIPAATWDKMDMPISTGKAHLGGWTVGSSISVDPSTSLVGFKPGSGFEDPTKPWPSKSSDLEMYKPFADSDDDLHPGLTVFPRGDAPYYYPHNSTDSTSPAIDALYVVTRTTLDLHGTSKSCTEYTGSANVSQLQTHIVGCREKGGGDCTAGDPNMGAWFIDANNTIYHVDSATFDSVKVPTNPNLVCADVANMFP